MEIEEILEQLSSKFDEYTKKTDEKFKVIDKVEAELRNVETVLARPVFSFNGNGNGSRKAGPVERTASGIAVLKQADRLSDLDSIPPLPDGIRREELSLGRIIRGLSTGSWSHADAEKRAMGASDPVSGGYLLPSLLAAEVIDKARAASALQTAGVRTVQIPEGGSLRFPRIDTDPSATWHGENSTVSSTSVGIGSVELKAKTLACLCPISYELLEDGPNVDLVLSDVIARALAVQIDAAGLFGSGTASEPLGLYNQPGVLSDEMGANGDTFPAIAAGTQPLQKILDVIELLYAQNAIPDCAIFSPRTGMTIDGMADMNGNTIQHTPTWTNLKRIMSSQVLNTVTHGSSSATSPIFIGGFQNMFLGTRTALRIEVVRNASLSDGTGLEKLQAIIVAYARLDYAVSRPSQLGILKGITV